MNRDYINWLETLPCNLNPEKVNVWMGSWAPLPEEIDLPAYENWQDRENQRNPKGVIHACGVGSIANKASYADSL